jgi:hypothetical protein
VCDLDVRIYERKRKTKEEELRTYLVETGKREKTMEHFDLPFVF